MSERLVRSQRENRRNPELWTGNLTLENLLEYKKGCNIIGQKLEEAIEKVSEKGKRPTLLIPSRGAFPIFLLALDKIKIGGYKIKYYPRCIFEYLSAQDLCEKSQGPSSTKVDVVLYPFTADVRAEGTDSEELSKMIRKSATFAFLSLTLGIEEGKKDLEWYFFLMGKLNPQSWPANMNPQAVVESLRSLQKEKVERQVVILDTVVSGRAAYHITQAFKDLGHPVIPVLAVDSLRKGFQEQFRDRIIKNTLSASFNFGLYSVNPYQEPFLELPLISEDQGPALLGVIALNFTNFNQKGVFSAQTTGQFEYGFVPQSCLWVPALKGSEESKIFKDFINLCRGPVHDSEDILNLRQEVEKVQRRGRVDSRWVGLLVREGGRNCTATETGSHIISLTLSQSTSHKWIREFSK